MAHDSDLPCEGDGNCMACKKKPPEYEIITCKTCVTPWHMTCLSVPPETLADAACWECPDCSFLANSNAPPASVAVPGRSELISAIGSIDVDRSLTEQEKAKRRQELLSGGIGRADDKSIGGNHEDVINGDNVLDLFQESLSCSFCMQLPERPITTPCGHNFCLKCFQKWVWQGKRTCANCRRAIPPEMVINPQINSSLVIAIRIAKMSKSNPSRRPQKVYNFVHSQNPPDKSYSTKHAKKALKEEFCSGKDFVTFPPDHFGPISAENGLERKHGVLVGETWENWMECRCWGVHLPHVDGAQSVALFGGNEDDEDHGKWFLYTGSGGRDLSGNKRKNTTQLLDQKIEKQNEALRESCQKGYPIRVVRVSNQKILHQADVCLKTSTSSIRSKTPANLCRQHAEFEDVDEVMVSVGPEHCLGSKYNRLQNRNVGPFKILHKINPNIYFLDLPDNMGITKIFNSEHLTLYQRRGVGLSNYNAPASHLPPDFNVQDEIEDIVDTKIVATRSGGYKKYLVKWRNKPWSDCTWVCDEDFQQLDCDFYDKYRSFNLSQLSFSKTGRDESHIRGRFGKYYKRKGYLDSEVNMIFFDRL